MIKSFNIAKKQDKFLKRLCDNHFEDNSSAMLRKILNNVELLYDKGIDLSERGNALRLIEKFDKV